MKTVEKFMKQLENCDIRCSYQTIGEKECVSVGFSARNFSGLTFFFIFDEEESSSVNIGCFEICKLPENKNLVMLQTVNNLNGRYRWVTFSITSDGRVNAEMSVAYTDENAEKLLFDSMYRIVDIVDSAYPVLMKALYV